MGKANIEDAKQTQARFQLTELPDLRVFRKGEAFKYGGNLNDLVASGNIVMCEQSGLSHIDLHNMYMYYVHVVQLYVGTVTSRSA